MREEVYHSKLDPVKLIELLDCLDDNVVKNIATEYALNLENHYEETYVSLPICFRLVGNCPNTYTYTKALAEQLLEKRCGSVPLVIVRPSIVTAAMKEPIPGWVDNMNGSTGI